MRDTTLLTNISCVKDFKRSGLRLLLDRAETLDFEDACELFDLSLAVRLIRRRRAPSSTSRWNFRRCGYSKYPRPGRLVYMEGWGAEKRRGKPWSSLATGTQYLLSPFPAWQQHVHLVVVEPLASSLYSIFR